MSLRVDITRHTYSRSLALALAQYLLAPFDHSIRYGQHILITALCALIRELLILLSGLDLCTQKGNQCHVG